MPGTKQAPNLWLLSGWLAFCLWREGVRGLVSVLSDEWACRASASGGVTIQAVFQLWG